LSTKSNKEKGIERRVSVPVYSKDILSEYGLITASLEIRGAWAWCLFTMWENGRYSVHGTFDEMGRLWGCSPDEASRIAAEIGERNIADVTISNGQVTLVSRRLKRQEKEREQAAKRQRDKRNRDRNAPVTEEKGVPSSSSSSSSSTSITKVTSGAGEARPRLIDDMDLKWTEAECISAGDRAGVPEAMCKAFFLHYAVSNFVRQGGAPIVNLGPALKKWQANEPSHANRYDTITRTPPDPEREARRAERREKLADADRRYAGMIERMKAGEDIPDADFEAVEAERAELMEDV
jgi:hypothetical protein